MDILKLNSKVKDKGNIESSYLITWVIRQDVYNAPDKIRISVKFQQRQWGKNNFKRSNNGVAIN